MYTFQKWIAIISKTVDVSLSYFSFSYEIKEPDDGEWGRQRNDGTWSGIIGLVARNVHVPLLNSKFL